MNCTTQSTALFLFNRGRDHTQAQYQCITRKSVRHIFSATRYISVATKNLSPCAVRWCLWIFSTLWILTLFCFPYIKRFKDPWHRETSIKRHNSQIRADTERIHKAQKRRVQMERKRNDKLKKLGIDFKSDALVRNVMIPPACYDPIQQKVQK